jgi:hypothetical protein
VTAKKIVQTVPVVGGRFHAHQKAPRGTEILKGMQKTVIALLGIGKGSGFEYASTLSVNDTEDVFILGHVDATKPDVAFPFVHRVVLLHVLIRCPGDLASPQPYLLYGALPPQVDLRPAHTRLSEKGQGQQSF